MIKKLSVLISAFALVAFALVLNHFVVNIPSRDDFGATLYYIQAHYFGNSTRLTK